MFNEVIDAIRSRRSVREFTRRDVEDDKVLMILEAARWAPSGVNLQPWKFVVVKDKGLMKKLAELTAYGYILEDASLALAVFLDNDVMYDRTKDVQAVGGCIQNMLLAAYSLNLGSVWIGEILRNKEEVNRLLGAPNSLELMAVVAVGYPAEKPRTSTRKDLSKLAYLDRYGNPLKLLSSV